MDVDGVWGTVDHWLGKWSEENREFVNDAVVRGAFMSVLQLVKRGNQKITELTDDGKRGRGIDVGAGLLALRAEMKQGASGQRKFQGPFDFESDLGGGVEIRLCDKFFADEATI